MAVTLGLVSWQPDRRQPGHQEWLAVGEDLTVLMPHHTVIGVGKDTSLRGHIRQGSGPPMPGDQRS